MRGWPAILALGLLACSQAPTATPVPKVSLTAAAASPTTEPSAEPSASPSDTPVSSITPSPIQAIPDLPLTKVSFSCRLPVYQSDARIVDEFLSFPSLTLTVSGYDGMYYDRAYSKWVPVPRFAVAPDGAHYASIENTGSDFVLHVVAVATGKDAPIHFATQTFNGQSSVFDYSADGIYVVTGFEHLFPGLWLVNPSTGQMRQVSRDIYPVLSAGNGIVWTEAVNPADPNPIVTGSSVGTLSDEID